MNKKAVILGNVNSPMGRPEPYSWFILTYWQGLERNGYNVTGINYKSNSLGEIKKQLLNIKPAICFTHLTFHQQINPISNVLQMYSEVSKQIGTKFIHTCNDAMTKDRFMGDVSHAYYMGMVGNFDMQKNCQKAWGIPVHYVPYSSLCYDQMASPVKELSFQEPVFTGSPGAHPDRADFIKRLSQKLSIKIFQTQSGNDLRHRTPELSVSAKCILGLCTGYSVWGYQDVRYWQFLGTGACFIARRFSNIRDIIPEDLYFGFDEYNNDSILQVIEYYKRSLKEDTNVMRKKAFDFIQKHHSCKVRIKNVLDAIDGKEITSDSYNFCNFI